MKSCFHPLFVFPFVPQQHTGPFKSSSSSPCLPFSTPRSSTTTKCSGGVLKLKAIDSHASVFTRDCPTRRFIPPFIPPAHSRLANNRQLPPTLPTYILFTSLTYSRARSSFWSAYSRASHTSSVRLPWSVAYAPLTDDTRLSV